MKTMIILAILFLFTTSLYSQGFVAVVNKSCQLTKISKDEVKNLYLGKKIQFSGSEVALAGYEPQADKNFDFLIKKTKNALIKIWLKKIFRGEEGTPPKYFDTADSLIDFIAANKSGICIIQENSIKSSKVKVITIIK